MIRSLNIIRVHCRFFLIPLLLLLLEPFLCFLKGRRGGEEGRPQLISPSSGALLSVPASVRAAASQPFAQFSQTFPKAASEGRGPNVNMLTVLLHGCDVPD